MIDIDLPTDELHCMLVKCDNNKLDKAEEFVKKLTAYANVLANKHTSAGIAKMNEWETYEKWEFGAFNNIETGHGDSCSDVQVSFTKPKRRSAVMGTTTHVEDGKIEAKKAKTKTNIQKETQQSKRKAKLAAAATTKKTPATFEKENWIIAITSIDSTSRLTFTTLETQIISIMFIDNSSNNSNTFNRENTRYFGYKIADKDAYGMLLYDRNQLGENGGIEPALRSRINSKCSFTVAIGCHGICDDDLGIDRVYSHLIQVKESASNQVIGGAAKTKEKEKTKKKMDVDDKVFLFLFILFCFILFCFVLFCFRDQ